MWLDWILDWIYAYDLGKYIMTKECDQELLPGYASYLTGKQKTKCNGVGAKALYIAPLRTIPRGNCA